MSGMATAPGNVAPQVFRDTPALALRRNLLPTGWALPFVALFAWWFFSRDLGFLIFMVVVGAVALGGYLAFRPSITFICTPEDFTLVHRNAREVFYLQSHPWRDLLNARYEETVQRTYRNGRVRTRITRTFAIELSDGYGVIFNEDTTNFHGLIATIGARTTHIPYLWVPAQSYVDQPAQQGGDYDLVPRAVLEASRSV